MSSVDDSLSPPMNMPDILVATSTKTVVCRFPKVP